MQHNSSNAAIYFITFTCYQWKPLVEITKSYDAVYKWFDYLAEKRCAIIGYVIMPNHLHVLVHFPAGIKNLNTIIGNAKRFMAYEIIKRLEKQKAEPLLQ
ncbi:MAG: transposase [Chitinophagaceae bacterium]